MRNLRARFEFKLADCWVGGYWKVYRHPTWDKTSRPIWVSFWDVWVCVVPTIPIHLSWERWSRRASA